MWPEIVKSAGIISRSWGLQYADSQDLAQELLLLALKIKDKPLCYIRKSMRNRAIDFLRKQKRMSWRLLPLEEAINVSIREVDFLSEMMQIERIRREMSKVQKAILSLLEQGRSMRESAIVLGVGRGSVSRTVRLMRAITGCQK